MRKPRVGILCGGRSAEHEISLLSARNIVDALSADSFEVIIIGIDKQGRWFLTDKEGISSPSVGSSLSVFVGKGSPLLVQPGGWVDLEESVSVTSAASLLPPSMSYFPFSTAHSGRMEQRKDYFGC